jgi:hypothetical protein
MSPVRRKVHGAYSYVRLYRSSPSAGHLVHSSPKTLFRFAATCVLVSSLDAVCAPALALPSGVATPNCSGCHAEGGYDGDLSLEALTALEPGQASEFVLTVKESHMSAAGFYVTTGGVGTFEANEGARTSAGDLLHSRPNTATDGVTEIHFDWTAPAEPGGTEFAVYVVAANLDGSSDGDRAGRAVVSLTWGCEPITLYSDLDTDGYGDPGSTVARCGASEGWAENADDCNDLVAFIHPGALEQANGRDDDCNGTVDDGIENALLYPDKDGDGFGAPALDPFEGQIGLDGYAANAEDCDDNDPEIHPDIEEVCDGRDNDCDMQVDEGTYEYCGVGRCARRLDRCDMECVPSEPLPEECNGLDDNCNGFIDDGDLCPEGQACVEFQCTPLTTSDGDPAAPAVVTGSSTGVPTPIDTATAFPDESAPAPTASATQSETAPAPPAPTATSASSASDATGAGTAAEDDVPSESTGCSVGSGSTRGSRAVPFALLALVTAYLTASSVRRRPG